MLQYRITPCYITLARWYNAYHTGTTQHVTRATWPAVVQEYQPSDTDDFEEGPPPTGFRNLAEARSPWVG